MIADKTTPNDLKEPAQTDVTNTSKKEYHSPQFTSLGKVEQLTLGGTSGIGETFGASV